jgi:hypothetical protein
MHRTLTVLILVALAACSSLTDAADPLSDAPEDRYIATTPIKVAPSYEQALLIWRNAEDLNAWIGTRFEYDMSRAMLLSETQRAKSGRLPIYSPEEFFSAPRGVCVDLSRFAVEMLRVIDPQVKPAFLLIEFAPVSIGGNTLRLHWLAMYRHQGSIVFTSSFRHDNTSSAR